ncbi:protochlorophyllide-dependent translocon component 52 [Carex littledalei]|uniref:Protochlorophyllide-dependent translocon component 52 n=1 Tax=Carex littledalei TaxID=544730 RepID=A0A833RLQ0_9POAL|nr:protochlorophyllide-dependent translocon component 52 [Carex littledalei]
MALRLSSLPSLAFSPSRPSMSSTRLQHSHLNHSSARLRISSSHSTPFTALTTNTNTVADQPNSTPTSETFDWFSHWYPLALLRDLDKRAPKGLMVLGLDVVIWWDRVEGAWKVFNDRCPHRLAPLSEGRIDHKGRLQCVYHGWCFDSAGACKYIPQAPALGPPVHKNEKACIAVYPSIEQNGLLWFWPNSSPQYKDIMHKTKPPYIPELDDPSFVSILSTREVLYGYEALTENILDPSHVPYAHHGLMDLQKKEDPGRYASTASILNFIYQEGGIPIELTIEKSDISGFGAKQDGGYHKFIAPCVYYFSIYKDHSVRTSWNEPIIVNIILCIPVRPGKSRVISITAWNFATWADKFVPRWYFYTGANLVIDLDSDLFLLHAQEQTVASERISNWHSSCNVPTKSDAMIVAFRTWLRKYSNNQVNWGTKEFTPLPTASLPKEQLMNRYWSHVVHCKSCSRALRALKFIKVSLQVVSIALIGILAAANHSLTSNSTKTIAVIVAVLCFLASNWLSQFIYKTFYYQDYNHAIFRTSQSLFKRIVGGI